MWTQVGYIGGSLVNPTYHRLGDHTESVQVGFDPEEITYAELLKVFWDSHAPCSGVCSVQYRSALFVHDEEQRRVAEKSRATEEARRGNKVSTAIEKAGRFYPAEDYHQKWMLRRHADITAEFLALYPELQDFTRSTAVTRVNGYLGGHGTAPQLEREIHRLGLSAAAEEKLRRSVRR